MVNAFAKIGKIFLNDNYRGKQVGLKNSSQGGPHSTIDSILASYQAAPGLILSIPKKFSLDVAEI